MSNGTGGWHLHLRCVTCGVEETYHGVVIHLAADAAERAGWSLDREALFAPLTERYATCPTH